MIYLLVVCEFAVRFMCLKYVTAQNTKQENTNPLAITKITDEILRPSVFVSD